MGSSMFKKITFLAPILLCSSLSFTLFAKNLISQLPSIEMFEESNNLAYFLPTQDDYVNWTFSGIVHNEQGDEYGYFFQIERNGNKLQSHAALFDAETRQLIFQNHEESAMTSSPYHWHVGHSFLTFNPITASWIFGFKNLTSEGFNFKINMLAQSNEGSMTETLRPGVSVMINQAHSLNGLIRKNNQTEEFVTAKHAWFRQIAMNSMDQSKHLMSGLLCHFDDNSRFYSMKLPESDALKGAMTGFFDSTGASQPISQFIQITQQDNQWQIDIPSHQQLILSDFLQQNTLIAGFVKSQQSLGFCLLSDESIG